MLGNRPLIGLIRLVYTDFLSFKRKQKNQCKSVESIQSVVHCGNFLQKSLSVGHVVAPHIQRFLKIGWQRAFKRHPLARCRMLKGE
jgi:hypothetical protein